MQASSPALNRRVCIFRMELGQNYVWLKTLSMRITTGGIMHKSLHPVPTVFKRTLRLQFCVMLPEPGPSSIAPCQPGDVHGKSRDPRTLQIYAGSQPVLNGTGLCTIFSRPLRNRYLFTF